MRKGRRKVDLPVSEIRRYLEPGPVVLVTSSWRGESNVMTMGWHTVMEFTPSLVGCVIAESNHSFGLIRRSKECVINIPSADLLDQVVGVGNTTGADIDKFAEFGLTRAKARRVAAPLIEECFANIECRLHDGRMIGRYNLFIFEAVKAQVAPSPRQPVTIHYTGEGVFRLSGKTVSRRAKFAPANL